MMRASRSAAGGCAAAGRSRGVLSACFTRLLPRANPSPLSLPPALLQHALRRQDARGHITYATQHGGVHEEDGMKANPPHLLGPLQISSHHARQLPAQQVRAHSCCVSLTLPLLHPWPLATPTTRCTPRASRTPSPHTLQCHFQRRRYSAAPTPKEQRRWGGLQVRCTVASYCASAVGPHALHAQLHAV